MSKKMVCIICSFVFLLSVFSFYCFGIQNMEPNASFEKEIKEQFLYEIYPVFEKQIYGLNDVIPVKIITNIDCKIQSIYSIGDGFLSNDAWIEDNNCILGSVICTAEKEEASFTIFVTLEDGSALETSIYAYIESDAIYLSGNSMFGARDLFWAEGLKSGTLTTLDYEDYLIQSTYGSILTGYDIENEQAVTASTTSSSIRISGLLQWEDDWGNLHPLQYTKVTIVDEIRNALLGTVYTNYNGRYTLRVSFVGECNPCLVVSPEGEGTVVQTGSGLEYFFRTEPCYGVTSSININSTIRMDCEVGQAFQVSQAILNASVYAQNVLGCNLESVTVKYPHNEQGNNCFYRSNERTIYICGSSHNNPLVINGEILYSYASWDVIQHEFFHHVQSQYEITDNPGGWHGVNGNIYLHYMSHHTSSGNFACVRDGEITCANPSVAEAKDKAIKIAYAEAMATVLAGMSQNYLVHEVSRLDSNIITVGDTVYTSYNRAVFDYEVSFDDDGETNEVTVASILWDIFDEENDAQDTVSLGDQEFWEVVIYNNNVTFSEFIASFYLLYPEYKEVIGDNLSYFGFAVAPHQEPYLTLYQLPNFAWRPNGSNSDSYQNNSFQLIFYDSLKYDKLTINVVGSSYTLTMEEWNTVLGFYGDCFYWSVAAFQDDGYGCITGPYHSQLKKMQKPVATEVYDAISVSGNLTTNKKYHWYKFVAPTSGTYVFYASGITDTYGEFYVSPFYGFDSSKTPINYDDDSGDDHNFLIQRELDYQEVVYLRVRGYDEMEGAYILHVNFIEHKHHYNMSYEALDNITHRSFCDCGLYEDEEHDWRNLGPEKMKCAQCSLILVGTVPGGSISSVGNGSVEENECPAILPELNRKENE